MKTKFNILFLQPIILLVAIFISFSSLAQTSVADVGKSYANISNISTGGTFKPNDVLEIRVVIAVRNVAPSQITAVQVFDTLPAKTTFIPNSLRITTNEGLTFRGPFTEAIDADQASCVGGNILINMGTGATAAAGGTITNTNKPKFFSSTCIMVACYRIRISPTALYGDTIRIGGRVSYRISGVLNTRNFSYYKIKLTQLNNIPCSNGTAISSAGDSLGTFASGTVQNRAAALAFATTYAKINIGGGVPQDYYYSIVNNSSANGSTNPNVALPSATNRVHGYWDIAGDHTGATNPIVGNPPIAPGTRGGYMVLINSSYKTDTAYRETLTNLCPNTNYEFSAWFRNVCPRCSCDSNGLGSGSVGFLPGPGNDSSGVRPNVNFEIDGLAYYSSGDMRYDRAVPWKKFGFTFLTRPGQTTADFLIRNNSPGGGGNDWVLDDIEISHCGPTLAMNYNPFVLGCSSNPFVVSLSDTIRYIFSNSYIYYKWQRSNVGGTIWTDLTGPGTSGIGVPTIVNGSYQYVTNLPPFLATAADSGRYYRVVTGTSVSNLSNNCAYNDKNATMIKVINCGIILSNEFIQFKAKKIQQNAQLYWTLSDENDLIGYEIERSDNAVTFEKIGFVSLNERNQHNYSFRDLTKINRNTYYRIKMISNRGLYKYSQIELINHELSFDVLNVLNPFKNFVTADFISPKEGRAVVQLFNDKGMLVKTQEMYLNTGLNKFKMEIQHGASGMYYLSVIFNQQPINKKIIKIN